mgnify:CR=1 FL=1
MTKEKILQTFEDINLVYNDCTRYDTLKRMLDELQEPCKDAISRQAVLNVVEKAVTKEVARWSIKELPPVNPQKPICPSAGVDCEDCPAYEPKILNKWIGAEVLDRIRNEMHATAEKHEDGVYYLRDEWIDEIIDKYAEEDKA